MIESALLILGITILYFGFAAALGLLIQKTFITPGAPFPGSLTVAFTLFVFLPASVVVLALTDLPFVFRALTVAAALLMVVGAAAQPDWLPDKLWRQPLRGGYLAVAMGFAALWSLNYALTSASSYTLLLGLAAASAALASARSSFQAA